MTRNPKDLIGIRKVQLGLLPAAGKIAGALAMQDGAAKYGPYNWRSTEVNLTIYLDAIERHLLALRDGEDEARDSGVHHLGHIIACASIILDAQETNNLVDDRPVEGPASRLLEAYAERNEASGANPALDPGSAGMTVCSSKLGHVDRRA